MVPDPDATAAENQSPLADERPPRDEPNTLMNAVVGAAATVLTAPLLPFAAIFGGALAGYLQRSDLAGGAKVGALSGAIAALPVFLLVWLVVGFFLLGHGPFFGVPSLFGLVAFFAVVGYFVGAGALGGAIGAYLRQEL
jgi:predicted lipid-binding transport protein (Tim44 family)